MGYFHIEGDWYVVPDENSWNLCKLKKNARHDHDWEKGITYHVSPEHAIVFYANRMRRKAAEEAHSGDLRALVEILSSENNRLAEALKPALRDIYDAKELKGEQ